MNIGTSAGTFSVPYLLPDGRTADLTTDKGVFSLGHVDPGTLILLDKAPDPPATGHLVDIGCGYGPISISLAMRAPGATVWAVDVNPRARELTRLNVDRLNLSNVRVVSPEEIPEGLAVDAIYSNPPLHTGKADLHQLMTTWLGRLRPGASAWLVVKKSRGSDSLMRWLTEQGHPNTKVASKRGFRIIHVSRPT